MTGESELAREKGVAILATGLSLVIVLLGCAYAAAAVIFLGKIDDPGRPAINWVVLFLSIAVVSFVAWAVSGRRLVGSIGAVVVGFVLMATGAIMAVTVSAKDGRAAWPHVLAAGGIVIVGGAIGIAAARRAARRNPYDL